MRCHKRAMSRASCPSSTGASDSCTAASAVAAAGYVSPRPISPESVCTRTHSQLIAPAWTVMAAFRGSVSSAVMRMGARSVADGKGNVKVGRCSM